MFSPQPPTPSRPKKRRARMTRKKNSFSSRNSRNSISSRNSRNSISSVNSSINKSESSYSDPPVVHRKPSAPGAMKGNNKSNNNIFNKEKQLLNKEKQLLNKYLPKTPINPRITRAVLDKNPNNIQKDVKNCINELKRKGELELLEGFGPVQLPKN